jgi:hypothetical protein
MREWEINGRFNSLRGLVSREGGFQLTVCSARTSIWFKVEGECEEVRRTKERRPAGRLEMLEVLGKVEDWSTNMRGFWEAADKEDYTAGTKRNAARLARKGRVGIVLVSMHTCVELSITIVEQCGGRRKGWWAFTEDGEGGKWLLSSNPGRN